jgi:putative oxidoreductase
MWNVIYTIGRVILVVIFIKSGVEKLMMPTGLTGMLGTKGFPQPMLFAYLAGVAEIVLGIMIAIGWQTRIAALGLIAFVVVATLLAHNYWAMEGAARRANEINFYKNLSIIGALLMLMAGGAGRYSVDRR